MCEREKRWSAPAHTVGARCRWEEWAWGGGVTADVRVRAVMCTHRSLSGSLRLPSSALRLLTPSSGCWTKRRRLLLRSASMANARRLSFIVAAELRTGSVGAEVQLRVSE